MSKMIQIGQKKIGKDHPCLIVAQISGNHHQNFDEAVALIHAAAEAGADAVKAQTYTADTLTFQSDKEWFRVSGKDQPGAWKGRTLHDLYQKAYTPWEWLPKLKKVAEDLGLLFFTSVFDETAVDLNEEMHVLVYKVASYEAVHIPLLKKIASTGKPVILSIGFASQEEVDLAIQTLQNHGARDLAVLHCVTTYSEKPVLDQSNLRTIEDIAERYDIVAGFSDNTGGIQIPVIAGTVAGGSIVEKHLILDRDAGGPDARFSIEPDEFKEMVQLIRKVERDSSVVNEILNPKQLESAMGHVQYGVASTVEAENLIFRPSLWVVREMQKGEVFTEESVRVARPNSGLTPRYYEEVIGKKAAQKIEAVTPLTEELIEGENL